MLSNEMRPSSVNLPKSIPSAAFVPAVEYMVDAAQRSILFWDVMRQRGNQFREHEAETVPNVLDYKAELVVDGRTDRVVGCHIVGDGAAEMVQVLGIAIKMKATKADFDATMAVHPTAAEELVTMRTPSLRHVRAAAE